MNNVQYEDLGRAGTRESRKDGKQLRGEGEEDEINKKREENQKVEVEKKSDISKKRGRL